MIGEGGHRDGDWVGRQWGVVGSGGSVGALERGWWVEDWPLEWNDILERDEG